MSLSPRCIGSKFFFSINPWMDVPGLCKTFLSIQAFDPCQVILDCALLRNVHRSFCCKRAVENFIEYM